MSETSKKVIYPEGFDINDFDETKAIRLDTIRSMLRGRGADKNPALEVVRRWCNHRIGCKVAPTTFLVLPFVRLAGQIFSMPAWVTAFIKERARIRFETEASAAQAEREAPRLARPARGVRAAQRQAEAVLDKAGIGN